MNRNMCGLLGSVSVGAVCAAMLATPVHAQIDEIIVTATKRAENAQNIPVAVGALDADTLEELDVDVFTDYLVQLPGVTAGGGGPGQSTIYIRGVASTTPNITTAGTAGLAPNVAIYLDEQPLAQPGRNLDVYAADLQRVEVLPGPQGTLFGASSQAGTVRLITNPPVLGAFQAKMSGGIAFTSGGEESYKLESVVNIPVTDNFALRGVIYMDQQGGYIDNVAGTRSAAESARFRDAGSMRDNGVPVSLARQGIQAPVALAEEGFDLSGVTFLETDNKALVEENFNDTTYVGGRLAGLVQITPDWSVRVMHARQSLDAEGVFFDDPALDDYQIQRFERDEGTDEFTNTAWTVEGRIGALQALYAGAFTDRTSEQLVDYSDYMFIGQYLPYYICDTSVTYPEADTAPSGTCQEPNLLADIRNELEVQTHELRFTTPVENKLRATFGAFYSNTELLEHNEYVYPGAAAYEWAPNYPLTNTSVTGEVGSAAAGFWSNPGPFEAPTIFWNDVLRIDKQMGLFGELTYDLVPNTLSATIGARIYDTEVTFQGSANSSFSNRGSTSDAQSAGTNLSAKFAGVTASSDGTVYKATLAWTPSDTALLFATYAEGFRPGLLNRPGGSMSSDGTYTVPLFVETDEIKNYEIGWKLDILDKTLRFNGSVFFNDIEGLQTTIFDPSITNLFFSDNAADAQIKGLEGDVIWAPKEISGLTVSGAFSFLDTEITNVLLPTNDVIAGEPLAFAPAFQGNIRARYEWDLGVWGTAHAMPQIVHSGSSFSDVIEINKFELDSWTTVDFRLGTSKDDWSVEVYAQNLTDERAELSGNFVFDRERVTVMRPRTIGLNFSVTY